MTKHEEMAHEFAEYEKGNEFRCLDKHLLAQGFKRITRGKGLGYQLHIDGKNVLVFVIRMSKTSGVFSLSAPYWTNKPEKIAEVRSSFGLFDIKPTAQKIGSSSRYSSLQIIFNSKNLDKIKMVIAETVIANSVNE